MPIVAPHLDVAHEVAALAAIESSTTEGVYEVAGARHLVDILPLDAWAIVTSGLRAVATLRIRHVGLPMPPVLVCADDVRRGKPDPEGYLVAARRLGRRPEQCVVIEDAPAGIEAACLAGMRSIAISGTYPATALASADVTVPRLTFIHVKGEPAGLLISLSPA